MYLGHVSVPHDDLSGLIRAAECLAIKGLAVPDEATSLPQSEPHGRPAAAAQEEGPEEGPPNPKRRRQDRDASSPAPLVQDTPAAENYNEGRVRGRVSRGSSPQPPSSTYTFPTQQEVRGTHPYYHYSHMCLYLSHLFMDRCGLTST